MEHPTCNHLFQGTQGIEKGHQGPKREKQQGTKLGAELSQAGSQRRLEGGRGRGRGETCCSSWLLLARPTRALQTLIPLCAASESGQTMEATARSTNPIAQDEAEGEMRSHSRALPFAPAAGESI